MKQVVAQVNAIRKLAAVGEELRTRAPGVPGIGLLWGRTGYGKTTAAAWWSNVVDAVYVRALATWTARTMLSSIVRELGAQPTATSAPMFEFIVERASATRSPIIVDEADYLARDSRLLETLRDLHDVANVPLILIGMEDFRRAVLHRKQLAGRIAQWIEFGPASIEDAAIVARSVCEVGLDEGLLAALHRSSSGEMRGLIVGLSRIEAFARQRGLGQVTLDEWGTRPFVLSNKE